MRKIAYIFISISLFTNLSCEKDWLTVPAETKFNSSSVFSSTEKAEMTVLGCYMSTFSREMYYQLGMGNDAVMSTESETNSKNQNANFVVTPDNAPSSTYTTLYAGIEYANNCIKGLESMSASNNNEQTKINTLLGESYAIRSMNYFNLIRYYGDVPFATKPVSDMNGVFTSSRVDRDSIYDAIIDDLQKAIELLPWYSEGSVPTYERFTKNAAYGILARVALYAAGYSLRWDLKTYAASSVKLAQRNDQARIKELYKIAADACAEVINKGENILMSNYEDIFKDIVNNTYNTEGMLELGQFGLNAKSHNIGYTIGIYCHQNSVFGKALPQMQAMPTFYYEFEEDDTRRDVSIANYSINADNTRSLNTIISRPVGKYRVTWKNEAGPAVNVRDINWPVLRYADVLLMHAEALNEYNNGPTAEAVESYEKVRTRAFGNDASKIGTTPSDYEGFKAAIIQERKFELAFEGFRRTDLIRWGILYDTLMATKEHLIELANREGRYANVALYAAYKEEQAAGYPDPVTAVPFKEYASLPDSITVHDDGYTAVVSMFGDAGIFFTNALTEDAVWVQSLFRGLEFEKDEILPFSQSGIMDQNEGLAGQQHPKYQ